MEEWLKEVWEKQVWPPSSHNYSLLDFSVWGVSELLVNAKFNKKNRGPEPEDEGGDGVLIDRGTVVKAC
jgi:hypothetical protein